MYKIKPAPGQVPIDRKTVHRKEDTLTIKFGLGTKARDVSPRQRITDISGASSAATAATAATDTAVTVSIPARPQPQPYPAFPGRSALMLQKMNTEPKPKWQGHYAIKQGKSSFIIYDKANTPKWSDTVASKPPSINAMFKRDLPTPTVVQLTLTKETAIPQVPAFYPDVHLFKPQILQSKVFRISKSAKPLVEEKQEPDVPVEIETKQEKKIVAVAVAKPAKPSKPEDPVLAAALRVLALLPERAPEYKTHNSYRSKKPKQSARTKMNVDNLLDRLEVHGAHHCHLHVTQPP